MNEKPSLASKILGLLGYVLVFIFLVCLFMPPTFFVFASFITLLIGLLIVLPVMGILYAGAWTLVLLVKLILSPFRAKKNV